MSEIIYDAIREERFRQDEKWGYPQRNTIPEWISILAEEFGEAAQAGNQYWFRDKSESDFHIYELCEHLKEELIQTAAVCVAFLDRLENESTERLFTRE